MKKLTIDGNTACALSMYATNEVAVIYPITPSSPMAESCDAWASEGKKNIYNTTMQVVEMQSEGGASGALHGSLVAGSLSTTFTASQGLLLMIPNMYKIAGELLPCVINVSARALATHALSIFGDHSDVMACRQTGFAMLCSNSVQEAHDFATIAMMTTLNTSVPFLHFFDGFRTSHEINKIEVLENDEIATLMPLDKIKQFKARALSSNNPQQFGTSQNPDVFFQNREAAEPYYKNVLSAIKQAFRQYATLTKRRYAPYEYVGAKDATSVVVLMGSAAETCENVAKYLNKKGEKVGVLKVRLYRPFFANEFCKALPNTVTNITVLDRTKESGANGPLYLDVVSAISNNKTLNHTKVLGGRYGLGGKDFTPGDALAVFKNNKDNGKNYFTVGINDDVSKSSLKTTPLKLNNQVTACLFYGLGSDGTVSANKNSIKIIGDNTNLNAQGYFVYDSKKSGSITISHLRFGKQVIKAPYEISHANFIACHNQRFIGKYDILKKLNNNGTFLLNTTWNIDELKERLPQEFIKAILDKKINFYIINADKIAQDLGLKGKINTIMQSAFFKLTNIINYNKAKEALKTAAKKSYGKAGDAVVMQNYNAIEEGGKNIVKVKVDASWLSNQDLTTTKSAFTKSAFAKNIMAPISQLEGDSLPVSAFTPSGNIPTDTAKYEKRGIAPFIPEWIKENCIQCNMCSTICPHGAIKAVLVDKNTPTPKGFVTVAARGYQDKEYRLQISPLDCTGCGCCVNVCPALNKALKMSDAITQIKQQAKNYEWADGYQNDKSVIDKSNIKGLQFAPCHFQFSGACAGCGETAYIKMATQLFGDNMLIANATGCSSIYGGSYPACPYVTNNEGKGPAWANSLFEDNAEFGLGMRIALDARKQHLTQLIQNAIDLKSKNKKLLTEWLSSNNNLDESAELATQIIDALKLEQKQAPTQLKKVLKQILDNTDALNEKSVWIIGGDGWSYDIGYGGLDHVLASNKNVNILVLDSQVYSNTGGQSSKATPLGAIAKFAEGGKRTAKKSLSLMALNYPNVFVAQISLGANYNQALQAFRQAQAHNGPSIIIAYSPCINHGVDMSNTYKNEKDAVLCGYWHLFHYLPTEQKLYLDSAEPTGDFVAFVKSQRRFANLYKKDPQLADSLIEQSKQDNIKLYQKLKKLAQD